jgi:peptidyl-prolyl cis-trans isomerase B (cyclophilin B)
MRTITTLCLTLALMTATVLSVSAQEEKKKYDKPGDMKIDPKKTYTATIDTSEGKIVAKLFPDKAPQTVNSFVFLAKEHFYDGTPFHRVIKGFMIQGGDPTGTGTGGPGYHLKAEFNDTKHERGILSMARAQDPDSAGSQFFIMHGNSPHLDGKYTAFGKVTEGMDVVDKIATTPTGAADRPEKPIVIKSVTIEEK